MDERSRVLTATVPRCRHRRRLGLVVHDGRRPPGPRSDSSRGSTTLSVEISRLRGTVDKARTAANEGWRSLNEMTGAQSGPLVGLGGDGRESRVDAGYDERDARHHGGW